jgi:hypothetical protein
MAIDFRELDDGSLLHVTVSGKLAHEDYSRFIPEFEMLIRKHGKIRILLEMRDFHGWQGTALWDDLKVDFKHFSDIEKIAMVGEAKWEKTMSMFCKPFTTATVRHFDVSQIEDAKQWIGLGSHHAVSS